MCEVNHRLDAILELREWMPSWRGFLLTLVIIDCNLDIWNQRFSIHPVNFESAVTKTTIYIGARLGKANLLDVLQIWSLAPLRCLHDVFTSSVIRRQRGLEQETQRKWWKQSNAYTNRTQITYISVLLFNAFPVFPPPSLPSSQRRITGRRDMTNWGCGNLQALVVLFSLQASSADKTSEHLCSNGRFLWPKKLKIRPR